MDRQRTEPVDRQTDRGPTLWTDRQRTDPVDGQTED